jgi:hypothetical protein
MSSSERPSQRTDNISLVKEHPSIEIHEPEAYKTLLKVTDCVIHKDWESYAMSFSKREVYNSLLELGMLPRQGAHSHSVIPDIPIDLEVEYRTRIVAEEMRQDRGNGSKCVDCKVLEEQVMVPHREVCYLIAYVYENSDGNHFEEREHIWLVNEAALSSSHENQHPSSHENWKIEFHGTIPANTTYESVFNLFKNICCITPGNS